MNCTQLNMHLIIGACVVFDVGGGVLLVNGVSKDYCLGKTFLFLIITYEPNKSRIKNL